MRDSIRSVASSDAPEKKTPRDFNCKRCTL
jgi:hypothetical protein